MWLLKQNNVNREKELFSTMEYLFGEEKLREKFKVINVVIFSKKAALSPPFVYKTLNRSLFVP